MFLDDIDFKHRAKEIQTVPGFTIWDLYMCSIVCVDDFRNAYLCKVQQGGISQVANRGLRHCYLEEHGLLDC